MNRKYFFTTLLLFIAGLSFAQQKPLKQKIAVFVPLYIDSCFNDEGEFKIVGNYLPKIMLPGLEFYNGVIMAVDSLEKAGVTNIELNIYDTKSSNKSIESIVNSVGFEDTKLMIASFNNRGEVKTLSDYAKAKQIPLISATYPNDGGVSTNPYFFLINPTLRTHCKGMLRYIQRNYSKDNVVYCTRKGAMEDMIKGYFTEEETPSPSTFNLKQKELTDSFTSKQLIALLDSTRNNVIVCGTANDAFAIRLLTEVAAIKKYKITVAGLPTFDALKVVEKSELKGLQIFYSSSFYYNKNDVLLAKLHNWYKAAYNAKASDMVYKGYEMMLRFGNGIAKYGNVITDFFGDNFFKVFNELQFEPVGFSGVETDYFENKKLYFIHKTDGIIKAVK